MRTPTSNLTHEDTVAYVEAAIARDLATTELQLMLRQLQVRYGCSSAGGVDWTTGELIQPDGSRNGAKIAELELTQLVKKQEAAEIYNLSWQAMLHRLRATYKAPMSAFPNDDGQWVANGRALPVSAAAPAAEAAPAPAPEAPQ